MIDIKAHEIEIAVAKHWNYRQNLIVPNVSWGWGMRYEADMIVCHKSGYCEEVEIKVTAQDISADLRKKHRHDDPRVKRLWFAVPEEIKDHPDIPIEAGILSVVRAGGRLVAKAYRVAKIRQKARPATDKERLKLAELGCMRIWSLKKHHTRGKQ